MEKRLLKNGYFLYDGCLHSFQVTDEFIISWGNKQLKVNLKRLDDGEKRLRFNRDSIGTLVMNSWIKRGIFNLCDSDGKPLNQ